jgi:hypothetical protein
MSEYRSDVTPTFGPREATSSSWRDRVERHLDGIYQDRGWDRLSDEERTARALPCEHCGAQRGKCYFGTRRRGRVYLDTSHEPRLRAARALLDGEREVTSV